MTRANSDTGPFALIPEWVLDADISATAVRAYCAVGRYADSDGHAFPGRRKLAERLHCSLATLDRALQELVELGALEVSARYGDDGRQTSNGYLVIRSDLRRGGRASEEVPLITGDEPITRTTNERERASAPSSRKPPKPRPRDPLWDAIVRVVGLEGRDLTKTEASNIGKTKRELAEAGATPEEVLRRADVYRRRYGANIDLTANALRKHWSSLAPPPERVGPDGNPFDGDYEWVGDVGEGPGA